MAAACIDTRATIDAGVIFRDYDRLWMIAVKAMEVSVKAIWKTLLKVILMRLRFRSFGCHLDVVVKKVVFASFFGFVMENNGGMNKREAFNMSVQYEHGDDLAVRMQRMKGNDGNAAAKPSRMSIRGLNNPNSRVGLKDTSSFTSSFDDSIVVPVPTGWTSYDQPSTMEPTSETPIVKSVDINSEPTSYAGATSASTKDQTKAEANFHSLVADKVFDGVNISIPRNIVDKGRSSFARCLIKINSESDLKDYIIIGIPDLEGPGFTKETIRDVYEWKPPRFVNKKHNNKRNSVINMLPKGGPVVKGRALLLTWFLMFSIASWNIRGLNRTPKQKEVRQVVNENLSVCAILESHVDVAAVYDICKKVCRRPWVLMGDLNAALNLENHLSAGCEPKVAMRDFKECVQAMEVSDINCTGLHFTWNKKSKGSNGILNNIDMIMGNLQFNDDFLGSFVIFQPYRILDHSLCVLRIPTVSKPKPKPFKFANFLLYKEGFREVVESGWNANIEGFAMYRVVKRLKGLRSLFRKLLHDHGNLHEQVNRIRIELDEAQKATDKDPSSSILCEEHAYYLLAFKEAQHDEERF
uniref:RNA-directed DNA polymerase, eukaryota, reverse transcriptase zinc-binding domain protein n=1 Tax=Tanacetum cinerariifolium TaxID=118510 RepID=A0A6L2KGA5_TANCI|nr:RNA-directed DNA polymerase, eukaryota, reverse transcriptase zinc-binding domain protein [Tanacetum cinerariifolium]